MNSNSPIELSRLDHLLLAFAGIGMAAFASVLLFSAGAEHQNPNVDPIGQIVLAQRDTRRRSSEGFSWNPVEQGAVIYQGDSVFTGAGSLAKIDLSGRGTVLLEPQSLVTFEVAGKIPVLELQSGSASFDLKQDTQLQLKRKDEVQNLQGSSEGTKIRVDLDAINSEGGISSVESKATKAQVELVYPENGSIVNVEEQGKLEFKWSGPKAPIRLQLARDREFESIIQVREANAHEVENQAMSVSLPGETIVYWRVESGSTRSRPAMTILAGIRPPKILYPPQDFDLELPRLEANARLHWEPVFGVRNYEVELSEDASFLKKSVQIEVESPEALMDLRAGRKYFWRVRQQQKNQEQYPWSEVGRFKTNLKDSEPLAELDRISRDLAAAERPITIADVPAVLAKQEELSLQHTSKVVLDPPQLSREKKFRYKVETLAELEIGKQVEVEWSASDDGSRFEVQISPDPNFKTFSQFLVSRPSVQFAVSPLKTYFLRVRWIDRGEEPESDFSNVMKVRLEYQLEIPVPVVLQPALATTVPILGPRTSVAMIWKESKAAEVYEVQFSKQPDGEEPLESTRVQGTSLVWIPKTSYKTIYWRVRAIAGSFYSSWSDTRLIQFER